MAKDPAFLFYSSDFLSGISDLTMEERGQYITLLCLQHQKGHLSKKMIQLSLGNATADVLHKFCVDENGFYYSERLELEINKRSKHSEKQSQRARDGWEKRKSKQVIPLDAVANAVALPLEDENDNSIKLTISREEDFKNQALKDEIWKEALFIKNLLTPKTIEFALNDYNIHLVQQGEKKISLKDYKQHFVNWVKKMKERKNSS